jgi:tetrapyrrole methylase family protein/MazG family protein
MASRSWCRGTSSTADLPGALERLLARFPGGVDVIPASALDRHSFSTLRAVVLVLDAKPDLPLLRKHYPASHPTTVLTESGDELSASLDSPLPPGARYVVLAPVDPFVDLASVAAVTRIADRLRAPDGCPWDREQTHASLRPHLLEEAYEALEALDSGDLDRLRDELGDLLFQIAIHAQLAYEEGAFDIADVARRLSEKLVRRHPHVFEGVAIEGGDLLAQWERIKRDERAETSEGAKDGGTGVQSVLGGVPKDLPALFAAERLQERAARLRMVAPRIELPVDVDDPEFLGEMLFDLVGAAREQGFDAESALREANERFIRHVARVETRARADGRALESYSADEMRRLWDETTQ